MLKSVKILLFALTILFPLNSPAQSEKDYSDIAIDYVKNKDKEAKNLSLFVTENYDFKMIRKSRVFKVSTADIIPIKNWIVVVDESGNPVIHSSRAARNFNRLIAYESLEFKTKSDYQKLIELFIGLTEPDEILVSNEKSIDTSRLKSEFKKSSIKTRIEKGKKGVYRLSFFSVNTLGSVKMWRLYFKPPGTIKKVSIYNATHY